MLCRRDRRGPLPVGAWLLLVVALSGCRTSQVASPRAATVVTPTPPAASLPDSIRWVRGSAEFVAAYEQVYRAATTRVESEARTHQPGQWAVILDADETVLNNSLYQEEQARAGLPYSDETWNTWVRRREATPLPGAAAFLARVRALGGRIAIVTNRMQVVCADTEAVFVTYQLAHDALLCRPQGASSDKNPRFQDVAAGRTPASPSPLEVVAYIGDNILDFPSLSQSLRTQGAGAFAEFGVRYFLLPNPMYGSWQ